MSHFISSDEQATRAEDEKRNQDERDAEEAQLWQPEPDEAIGLTKEGLINQGGRTQAKFDKDEGIIFN